MIAGSLVRLVIASAALAVAACQTGDDVGALRVSLDQACGDGSNIELKVYEATTCDELKDSLNRPTLIDTTVDLAVPKVLRFGSGQRTIFAATRDDKGQLTCRACRDDVVFRGGRNPQVDLALTPVLTGEDCASATELVPGVVLDNQVLSASYSDDIQGTCATPGGADRVYRVTLAQPSHVRVDVTTNFSAWVVMRLNSSCAPDPLMPTKGGSCEKTVNFMTVKGPRQIGTIEIKDVAAGELYFWVEGRTPSDIGTFSIAASVSEARPITEVPNESCRVQKDLDGNPITGPSVIDPTQQDNVTRDITYAADDFNLTCVQGDQDRGDMTYELRIPRPVDDAAADDSRLFVFAAPYGATPPAQTPTWAPLLEFRTNACGLDSPYCVSHGGATRFFNFLTPRPDPNTSFVSYYLIVDAGRKGTGPVTVTAKVVSGAPLFGYYMRHQALETYQPLTTNGVDGNTPFTVTLDGWAFPFFAPGPAQMISEVTVSPNGVVRLGPGGAAGLDMPDCLNAAPATSLIAPFWQRAGAPGGASTIRTELKFADGQRSLAIEWVDFDLKNCGGGSSYCGARLNHKLVLYDNGVIAMHYGPRSGPDSDTLEGFGTTIGFQFSQNLGEYGQVRCTSDAVGVGRVTADSVTYLVPPDEWIAREPNTQL